MLYQGHVAHFRRTADPVSGEPVFTQVVGLHLSETSAFALTAIGEEFATDFLVSAFTASTRAAAQASLFLGCLTPHYYKDDRIFGWGVHVLKHFQQSAGNQELIVCTAEELKWVNWFDDPLPRLAKGNPKVRLHDTIKDLNRRQKLPLVQFVGDGTGTRVGWRFR